MSSPNNSHKQKIVYVEDDEGMRNLMYEILKDDFDIRVTASAEGLMKLCENEDIAIVMTDHHMEPVTGVEILQELYVKHPDIRRVLITGDTSSEIIFNAVKEGRIHGFFHKPLDFEKLRRELQEYGQRYQDHQAKSAKTKDLQEELIKLREALYQKNTRIYHTFNSLRETEESNMAEKISTLYLSKFTKIKHIWEAAENKTLQVNDILVLIEELIILSEEFNTHCFSIWLSEIKLSLELFGNYDVKVNREISEIKNNISKYAHQQCKNSLNELIDDLIVTTRSDQPTRLHERYNQIISELMNQILLVITNTGIFDIQTSISDDIIEDLGYILVVVDQVTVYSRAYKTKSDLHPSLIGNLAVAVNDFSKELFDDFSGVQTIEQENGTLLIHRASEDIYYIAMAYTESYLYQVYLKEFAKNTLNLFIRKSKSKTFKKEELEDIDEILDNIILRHNS